VTLDELQSTDLLKFEQNRIRKVDTQMVHDAVHIRKHMMNGEDEQGPTLASDKMRKLKKDPFEQMIIQETQPMFTRKNMWNLCFPSGRVVPDPCIKRFVNGLFFKSITMIAIAANTLYLGLVADNNVKNSYRRFLGDTVPKPSVIPDISFTAWFSVEIPVKMAADRLDFFVGMKSIGICSTWLWWLKPSSACSLKVQSSPSCGFFASFVWSESSKWYDRSKRWRDCGR